MINYKKINLRCLDNLKSYVVNQIKDLLLPTGRLTVVTTFVVTLPDKLLKIINEELSSYSISNIEYCRVYLWKKGSVQTPHVDGSDEVLHCSINIPLHGGENSTFRWYSGDYDLKLDDIGKNQKAYVVNWNSSPYITESIEIKDGCYLVRIDQPHQAIASADSDRWVFTMRFKGNPAFEELYDKLPASNV